MAHWDVGQERIQYRSEGMEVEVDVTNINLGTEFQTRSSSSLILHPTVFLGLYRRVFL